MFKLVLITIALLLLPAGSVTADAAVDSTASVDTAAALTANKSRTSLRGTCSADAGRCKVTRFRRGTAQLQFSQTPRTVKVVPPTRSGQSAYDLVFDSGPVADCSAEVSCPDGSTASCAATGTNTQCTSNVSSVGCLTADSNGEGTSGSSSSCGS